MLLISKFLVYICLLHIINVVGQDNSDLPGFKFIDPLPGSGGRAGNLPTTTEAPKTTSGNGSAGSTSSFDGNECTGTITDIVLEQHIWVNTIFRNCDEINDSHLIAVNGSFNLGDVTAGIAELNDEAYFSLLKTLHIGPLSKIAFKWHDEIPSFFQKINTLEMEGLSFVDDVLTLTVHEPLSSLMVNNTNAKDVQLYYDGGNPLTSLSISGESFTQVPQAFTKKVLAPGLKELYMSLPNASNERLDSVKEAILSANVKNSKAVECQAPQIPSVSKICNNSPSDADTGFPWVYAILGAITIGLLVGTFVYWSSKKKLKLGTQMDPVEAYESTQESTPYMKFQTTVLNAIAENVAPVTIVVPSEKDRRKRSTIGVQEPTKHGVYTLYNSLKVYRIDLKDIEDIRSIGSGAFAVVWLVRYHNRQLLASKRLRTDDLKVLSSTQMEAFMQEIQMVSMLKHTNIVEFIGVAWDGADKKVNLQMLFEYMGGGDLKLCLSKHPNSSHNGPYLPRYWNSNKIAIARDIAAALVYLHSFRPPILHRDLKAKNILLTSDYSTAKLSDFGVARIRSQNTTTMTGGVGTGRWLAPEIANGYTKYNESCDIYSFGIVLMELETHDTPFINVKNEANEPLPDIAVLYKIFHGDLSPMIGFSQDCESHEGIYALAERCLSLDAKSRPSALIIMLELDNLLQLESKKITNTQSV